MKNIFSIRKPSPSLQLILKATKHLLEIGQDPLTQDEFQQLVLNNEETIIQKIETIDITYITEDQADALFELYNCPDYNPNVAVKESESKFFHEIGRIHQKLLLDITEAHRQNKRLFPFTSLLIGVDGSRQSFMTFELAMRLRRKGKFVVLNVDEKQGGRLQMPVISHDVILNEYKSYCEKKHIHKSDYQIVWDDNTTQQDSVAKRIMNEASTNSVDFIVVGAIGKGGPGVDQVGHVPKEIVVSSIFPVVVVPPEPVNTIPYKSSTFVLAVDGSRNSLRGLTETFKLMHAGDKLRVIHFYKKPICGSYDTQAFQVYEQAIQDVKVEGIMEIIELENGWTIAESIQKYIAVHRAAYLVVGREGESKENPQNDPIKKEDLTKSLGRITRSLLRSPRCALVLCP